jgi:hypothetical protein
MAAAITPNPAFEVDYRQGGDKTRHAVSKYMQSKTEIYYYLNRLLDDVEQTKDETTVTFSVNGEEI